MRYVIVLESDPHSATLVRRLLEKRGGCRVTVSEDPAELISAAVPGTLDLVVMDVSLAHSRDDAESPSGVDVCRRLKADPRTAALPVLLATAHAMAGDAQRLLAASGADAYVSKPILDHTDFVARALELMEDAA